MAEELTQQPPTKLDKPPSAPGAPPSEPVIHVIPDKFYGAALRKKVIEPPKPSAAFAPPPRPPGSQPPSSRPPAPPRPKGKGGGLVIAIVVFLLLGAVGVGYFGYTRGWFDQILKPSVKPSVTNQNQNANVHVPVKPVCGDGQCQATETAENCAADCAPEPTCGDGQCQATETAENCAADCAPEPTCGDGQCQAPESEESCPADCQPTEPELGPDADNDGVSDIEETAIYGTNPNDPDSDHDSFLDLNEIYNLFNPALPSPSPLKDNPGIAAYRNAVQGYEVLRPAGWTVRESGEDNQEAYFTAPSGEFIEILAQAKPPSQSLMDWYLAQAPGVRSSDVQVFRTKGGYEEILSSDRMTAFVATDGQVYVISYNLANQSLIQYRATFAMIANSLKVTSR